MRFGNVGQFTGVAVGPGNRGVFIVAQVRIVLHIHKMIVAEFGHIERLGPPVIHGRVVDQGQVDPQAKGAEVHAAVGKRNPGIHTRVGRARIDGE